MFLWDDLTSLTLATYHVLVGGLQCTLDTKPIRQSCWPEQQEPNETYQKPAHGIFPPSVLAVLAQGSIRP